MRKALFSFIPVLLFIACAHAQSSTRTIQDFGLVGKWAIECSRPPAPANEHSLFAVTSSGSILVMNDFGPDYDGMVYRVVHAEPVGLDKISLRQVLTTDEAVVLDIVMLKNNERIRVWSSRTADGNMFVKDGTIASANDHATRWHNRCEEKRAGSPNPTVK
jgi:hypothetical protein